MIALYAGIGALAVGLFTGWQVHAWKAGADERDRIAADAREVVRRIDRADEAAGRHEAFKADAQARERIVIEEVERVVVRPVYRADCIDGDGLRILRDAIGARAPGKPAPAVRAASGAD